MPSPVGHAIGGVAAGWALAGIRRAPLQTVCFAAAAMAPDLDLLFGAHSGPTHGLGAAAIAGVVAWVMACAVPALRPAHGVGPTLFALAVALAYGSHTLLDWMSTDSSPPIGIMALWPVSRDYYESSLHVFLAVSRRYWRDDFVALNTRALVRELLVLLPVLAIVWFARRTQRGI